MKDSIQHPDLLRHQDGRRFKDFAQLRTGSVNLSELSKFPEY